MALNLNLREALKDKKNRSAVMLVGLFVVFLLVLAVLPGGKKESEKKASFSKEEREASPQDSELDRILAELKKEQQEKSTSPASVNTLPQSEPQSHKAGPSVVLSSSPELQKKQEKLQKEMMRFQLEKQEMELKIQRLQLQARYLSSIAQIKSAKKKLEELEAENSKEVLVYDASSQQEKAQEHKSGSATPQIIGLSETIEIPSGTFIDGIVQNRVSVNNGETAPIVVVVDRNIPNLYKRGEILFPRGTKFVGETLPFSENADRLVYAFHTMVLPDGEEISLVDKKDNIIAANIKGMKGAASSVNRHFWSLLAKSALIGLTEAGTMMLTPSAGFYTPGLFNAGFVPYTTPQDQNSPQQQTISRGKMVRDMALRNALYQMSEGIRSGVSSTMQPKTTIVIEAGKRVKLFFAKKFVYER